MLRTSTVKTTEAVPQELQRIFWMQDTTIAEELVAMNLAEWGEEPGI